MKKAIVLLNMGGPNNLDEVKLFLTNMFNDARIIAAPKPLRWLIAKIITTKRTEAAKENYRLLGGKSPIMKYTDALVKKLEAKVDARVSPLMRYTPPFAKEVLESLQDMDAIYAIPLYPQYSATTTASSFDDLFKNAKSLGISDKIKTIEHYPTHPLYIASICKRIQEALGKDKAEDFDLIFSAHGLPQKMIDRGDPYQKEIKNTLFMARKALIEAELNFAATHLAYQSRLGPMKWIEPYMDEKLKTMRGKKVIVFPIAFTIDNSETEYELDIEYRALAKEIGIAEYRVAKAPNDDDNFVDCLVDLYKKMEVK